MAHYDRLMELLMKSENIVALTGAGISTSSGVPDFRSPKGIYADPSVDGERVFDIKVFEEDPTVFGRFFAKLYPQMRDGAPTKGHIMLKKLEDMGKLKSVITQNIGGLHSKAGSKNVVEVHGHIRDYVCINSVHHKIPTKDLNQDSLLNGETVLCSECGAFMKPDVVFFGEKILCYEKALTQVQNADLLLVMGTSLTVYPIAGLPGYCGDSAKLVIINDSPTSYDQDADLVIREDIDTVAGKLGLC